MHKFLFEYYKTAPKIFGAASLTGASVLTAYFLPKVSQSNYALSFSSVYGESFPTDPSKDDLLPIKEKDLLTKVGECQQRNAVALKNFSRYKI